MASLCILLVALVATIQATCVREFFAQPVIYDRAMKIDFYYTGINQSTVAACAAFCGDRHFCRTAVYNTVTKTCAISYEYTLNCRYNEKRFTSFDLAGITSHLIQVACVTKCNEEAKTRSEGAQRDPPMLNSPGVPNILKKVSLITGEPNDGHSTSDDSVEVALPNYAALARARDPGYNAPNNNDIVRDEGYVNKLVIANISAQHDVIVNSYVKNGSQICYRRIQHKYLLGGSFQRHDGKTIIECRCLCAASYTAHILHRCQSFHWYKSGVCVLNKGSHAGKYDLIEDYQATYEYVDCDVQVLLDVADEVCNQHENETTPATKDISRTTQTKEKKTTTGKPNRKRNRNGTSKKPKAKKNRPVHKEVTKPIVAVEKPETTTEKSIEAPVTETSTTEVSPTTTSSAESPNTTTTIESTENKQIEKSDNSEVDATKSAPSKFKQEPETPANETSTTIEEKTETNATNGNIAEPAEEVAEKPRHREPNSEEIEKVTTTQSTTTETATTNTQPETTTTLEPTTSTETVEEKLNVEQHGCFERIHEHMMVSVAGGLEHDVSMEECQCLCANSRALGRYSFECNSATYYHTEKDCVLNLDDRFQKKLLFDKQPGDFNVTYIGITCDRAFAISSIVDHSATHGCRKSAPATTPKPTKKKGSKGAHSDKCFVELPSFVLEGTAQQVETGVSPQECKCLCAQSDERYGEGCQSFQYYYDSRTCLLNKLNRFSNPENFNFVPETQPRSYFEFRCGALGDKLRHYLADTCPDAKLTGNKEHSTDEPDSTEPESSEAPKPVAEIEPETKEVSSEAQTKKEGRTWTEGDINVESGEKPEKTEKIKKSKTIKRVKSDGKRKDPEISGEIPSEPKEEEDVPEEETSTEVEEEEPTTSTTTTTTTTEETTTTTLAAKRYKTIKKRGHINRAIPEAEGLDEADFDEEMEVEVTDAPKKQTPQADPIANDLRPHRALGVKTQKFTDKIEKEKIPLIETTVATSTTTKATTTTTEKPTTTTEVETTPAGPEYPSAGHCTYSALYQTQFQGRKMIKTVYVKNATDCFAACYVLRCRSASLVAQGTLNQCILYRDSLIDYRNPNMLDYDRSTVYFDGIRCDGKVSANSLA